MTLRDTKVHAQRPLRAAHHALRTRPLRKMTDR